MRNAFKRSSKYLRDTDHFVCGKVESRRQAESISSFKLAITAFLIVVFINGCSVNTDIKLMKTRSKYVIEEIQLDLDEN